MFDYNGTVLSATECYDGWANNFGYTNGYYCGGPSVPFDVSFTPFNAFINLNTGIVMHKDGNGNYLSGAAQIKSLMQEAAE